MPRRRRSSVAGRLKRARQLGRAAPDEEARRLAALWGAATPATGPVPRDELWPAAAGDDLGAFAAALDRLQALNRAALAAAGLPAAPTPAEEATLGVMRASGALHCGRAPAGRALYALVEGAALSRTLRIALTQHLGPLGGTVLATIGDPAGVRLKA